MTPTPPCRPWRATTDRETARIYRMNTATPWYCALCTGRKATFRFPMLPTATDMTDTYDGGRLTVVTGGWIGACRWCRNDVDGGAMDRIRERYPFHPDAVIEHVWSLFPERKTGPAKALPAELRVAG